MNEAIEKMKARGYNGLVRAVICVVLKIGRIVRPL